MKPGYRTEQLLPFIHISSVPNQRHEGVIVSGFMTSSLKQDSWKGKFVLREGKVFSVGS